MPRPLVRSSHPYTTGFLHAALVRVAAAARDALESALVAGKRAESVTVVHRALDWLADQLAVHPGAIRKPGEMACRGEDQGPGPDS